ncbi:MAG: 50S ribosomal protein L30 [Clostridiales bacterium]|jgi:ribosomal protein L30|nr:50S ribosomal protein L30 [Clostridiales bacterium]
MEQIKITLTGSLIGSSPKQKAVAKSLGLTKIGDVTVQKNDASVLGKVKIIAHLIKVENV